jgi:hypothetical protein
MFLYNTYIYIYTDLVYDAVFALELLEVLVVLAVDRAILLAEVL